MLKIAILMAGLLAGLATASAADLPAKAPAKRVNPFISYIGSGGYWFAGGFGGSTDINTGVGHLSATGAGVSAGGGWMWGHTTTWTAVDLRLNYTTLSAAGLCGAAVAVCAFRQNASVEVRAKYGSDSSTLANWLPNLNLSGLFDVLPGVPVGVSTPSHPYIFGYGEAGRSRVDILVLDQSKWRAEFGGGVGMVHQIGTNKAIDTWAKCGLDTGSSIGGAGVNLKLGTACRGGMDLIF